MITPGLWKTLTIVAPQNVLDEVRHLAGEMQATGAKFDTSLTAKCQWVKDNVIQPELMARIPQLYASTALIYPVAMPFPAWLFQQGYSLDKLDSCLDHIANPEVLMPWAAMEVIQAVLLESMVGYSSGSELGDIQARKIIKDEVTEQIRIRRPRSLNALKLDLNQDGQITDNERAVTKMQVLWRR